MAKTAKIKANPTANPRSRASKRATSPSINVDKSLKGAPRASDATPVLSARANSGVTKSKRKQKPLTKGQRRRHEKGLARAEIVQDRLSKKVDDASTRLKKSRERKGMWDEVNGTAQFDKLKAALGDDADQSGKEEEEEWVDEDMEEVEANTGGTNSVEILPTISEPKLVVVERKAPDPTGVDDEADKIT